MPYKSFLVTKFSVYGIWISNGAQSNIIGGTIPGSRNVISGNTGNGISIYNAGTDNNVIIGNYIGTAVNGTISLGNSGEGISIALGAQYNTIGGADASMRNIISGNSGEDSDGVQILGSETDHNVIQGNYIGTDVNGTWDLGNSEHGVKIIDSKFTKVGGTTESERNIISGNNGYGVVISGEESSNNIVSGNYIGTDANGTEALGNTEFGVEIRYGAQSNIVGGTTPGTRNIISGNGEGEIRMRSSGTNNNKVQGNYIGVDVNGDGPLGSTRIDGVTITEGAQSNIIGGGIEGARNIISGNRNNGIRISNSGTDNNVIAGNYIGPDYTGTKELSIRNGDGIGIYDGANNIIGGTTPGERNVISGNDGRGIEVEGANENQILGNYIGIDATGNAALGNTENGIIFDFGAQSNVVSGNSIGNNGRNGVAVVDEDSDYNKISQNSINNNNEKGIELEDGGNDEIPAPSANVELNGNILSVTGGNGAGSNATVEVLKADSAASGEGETYLGSLTADGNGNFSGDIDVTGKGVLPGDSFVATTTHTNGNTSEFGLLDPSGPTPPSALYITRTDSSPTNATSIRFTVIFSENVTGVDISDFVLTRTGTANGVISSVSASQVATVTVNNITGTGTLRLDLIDNDSIKDDEGTPLGGTGAGNGSFTTGEAYTIIQYAAINVNLPVLTADPGSTVTIGINFDSVAGIAGADITLTYDPAIIKVKASRATALANGLTTITNTYTLGRIVFASAGPVALTGGSGALFEVDFEVIANSGKSDLKLQSIGIYDVYVNDIPVNVANGSITVNTVKSPSVLSITRMDSNPTNADSVKFAVTFSEDVTGVDTGDFILTKTGTANGFISLVSASQVATVTVNNVTGDGTLRLDLIDDDSIRNGEDTPLGGVGSGNGNFTSGEIYIIVSDGNIEMVNMKAGWNLISFRIIKCFYYGNKPDLPLYLEMVDVGEKGYNSLAEWFDSTITPKDSWTMVIGTEGAMGVSSDSQSLKYMSPLSGYWVKIKPGVENAVMTLAGSVFDLSNAIPLTIDWNLVGCPIGVGYYDTAGHPDVPGVTKWIPVNPPVADYVFDSIRNKYSMIIGTRGAFNPSLPSALNSLHYIVPNDAFWIKMTQKAELTYPEEQ